jgi:hypothetical protein
MNRYQYNPMALEGENTGNFSTSKEKKNPPEHCNFSHSLITQTKIDKTPIICNHMLQNQALFYGIPSCSSRATLIS